MLKKLTKRINKLDASTEAPRFTEQFLKMSPSALNKFRDQGMDDNEIKKSHTLLSLVMLEQIKLIPKIVSELVNILKSKSYEPAFRCVVASSLAYLVQPKDLLPDDLPGGYGFIDDALLLHESCALSWEIRGDLKRAEDSRKIFQFINLFVPDNSHELFQAAINGLATTINLLRQLDPFDAEMYVNEIISNPLLAMQEQVQASNNLSSYGAQICDYPSKTDYTFTWKDGDNMGVNFSGGGGVSTNGRDIFCF